MKKKIKLFIKSILLLFMLLFFTEIFISFLPINLENISKSNLILLNFIGDIIFFIIIISCYYKDLIKDFKDYIHNLWDNLEISFKYWLLGFIIMVISNLIITMITNGEIANNEEAIRELIKLAPLYMLFSVSIYAPFTEELVFRKSFKDIIINKWVYIIISGLVFGSLHVIGSVENITDMLFIIPYTSLGIAFAYTYYKTNNIFSTITMHAFHNTMAIILYFIGNLL